MLFRICVFALAAVCLLLFRAGWVFLRLLSMTFWFPLDYGYEFRQRFWRFR